MHNSVFIGIGVDKFSGLNIEPLDFCASDLKFIYRLFYVFNICNKCHYLINEQATSFNILETLNNFKSFEGNIVIFYSSHGRNIDNRSKLLCYDTNLLAMDETSLSTDNIITILAKYKSKNIKLFLDACNISVNRSITPKNLKIYYPDKDITHEDTILNHSVFVNKLLHDYSSELRYNETANRLSKRNQRLRQKIANYFIRHSNLLCITGESGIGKSHFLRNMAENEENTYYVSIPNRKNITLNLILNLVTQEITKQKNTNFDIDPERYLLFFDSLHPYSLFILDHTENLTAQVNLALISFLKKFKSQIIISTKEIAGNFSPSEMVIMPELNEAAIKELLKELNISSNVNIDGLLECSNYLQVLKKIHSITNGAISNKNVIEAIISTGGYANQTLFCKKFKIANKEINKLKNAGVIIKHDDLYYPHDSLYDKVSDENVYKLSNLACSYWKEECKSNSIKSIYQYILVLTYFNPNFDIKDEELFINIISRLHGRNNMHFLLSLYGYLIEQDLTPALTTKMAESLIDISKYEMAKNIINKCNIGCPILNSLSVECLWWEGNFEQTIINANRYLSENNTANSKYNLMCSRGIAHFFLGDWQSAKTDLSTIVAHKEDANNKCLFMSYCVLATIDGIRGTCFPGSIENFIAAIEVAKKAKKHSWIAIAFGNIGEIFWKAGYADFAIKILNIADELSYLNGNDAF